MTTFLDQRSNTLLYSTENKIKIEGYYYCRGVFSGAAMAPPALHLRENTRGTRQGCLLTPYLERDEHFAGMVVPTLGQPTAAHRNTCDTLWTSVDAQTHTCSFTRAELPLVVFAPRLYVKQRQSLAKPTPVQ